MYRRDAKQLVLVGGGHSHLAVLRWLVMRPIDGLRVVLVAREAHAPYSGMLPGLLRGWYGFDECHFDLRRLAAAAGTSLITASATGLDLRSHELTTSAGHQLPYDLLSINCGAEPQLPAHVAADARVVPVKPISTLLPHWQAAEGRIRARHLAGKRSRVAVVGAGAGGCELALALVDRLRNLSAELVLVDSGARVGKGLAPGARARLAEVLAREGVRVRLNVRVEGIDTGGLQCADGAFIDADEVLWATSATGPAWLRDSGLTTEAGGYLSVDRYLRCIGHSDVFAAGDVAMVQDNVRPRAGVFAVRQGPVLAENLERTLFGRPLRSYRAQRRYLSVLALPGRTAIASRGRLWWSGPGVWKLKDAIDRRFMARFALTAPTDVAMAPPLRRTLPQLSGNSAEADVPYCAGCAAKLGTDVLSQALAEVRLDALSPSNVLVGLDQPDDAAVLAPSSTPTVLTIDGLRAIDSDLQLAAALAVNHALGDCFAMGAAPAGVLVWATVAQASSHIQRADLRASMSGVMRVLRPVPTPLLGGHSSTGLEASMGVTVVGQLATPRWLSKAGLRVGDALLLSKPLGVATLYAAPMRGAGRARWLQAAIAAMLVSLQRHAEGAVAAGAVAATDVTGFGLLGHLAEMLRASGTAVELYCDTVPAYDGALALLAQGIESSLAPENARTLADFVLRDGLHADDPRIRLLADPQTCGGLLVGVAPEAVDAVLGSWRQHGTVGACIGRVVQARADGALGELGLLRSQRSQRSQHNQDAIRRTPQ